MMKFVSTETKISGHLALITANLFFGLNMPIAKSVFASELVTPLALNLFRMGGAAMLFWITSLFTKYEKVNWRDLLLLFGASLLGVQINQLSFLLGLSMTTPIDASIIATMVPILTMLLAALYLKEPITFKKATGVLIGTAGALLLILTSTHIGNGNHSSMMGNLLCVLSALTFASYLSFCKPLIMRYSPITLMKWMFLFATIVFTPICYDDVIRVDYSALPLDIYVRMFYVVFCSTFIAYILIPIGQKNLRPTIVSMYSYVQPLVASIAAVVIGMDTFGWHKALAGGLVFLGVYVVTISRAREQSIGR